VVGDLVVELEGKPAEDTRQIQEALGNVKVGDKLTLTVLRGGSPVHLPIVLGDRPAR